MIRELMHPVWSDLVGQSAVVSTLSAAVDASRGFDDQASQAMSHAWLFTGPPGSGRSNAALAFAAALQCEVGGCGQCRSCTSAAAGSHPDIAVIATSGLSIGVDDAREIVRKSALHPAVSQWQILVIEDADRLTEQAANALLKAIEEPTRFTLWLLCAPAVEDVIMTVRSRCRSVVLRTPHVGDIARLLTERDGIDPELARSAAAASQGHIGRARRLARDVDARARRAEIIALPAGLRDLGDCLRAAKRIDEEASARAAAYCDEADPREREQLQASWGVEHRGKRPAGYAGALSALTKDQERRRKRMARDEIDGVLLELLSVLRDVVSIQLGSRGGLVNSEASTMIQQLAADREPESVLIAIDAVLACREALGANAAPLLALESTMMRLLP